MEKLKLDTHQVQLANFARAAFLVLNFYTHHQFSEKKIINNNFKNLFTLSLCIFHFDPGNSFLISGVPKN